MAAPSVTKAAIQRTIEAAKAAGIIPGAVTVSKDGTVRVEAAQEKEVVSGDNRGQVMTPKKWATR